MNEDINDRVQTRSFIQLLACAGDHSRMVKEGEAVLGANHLVLVGVKKIDNAGTHVFGSCLQSSTIRSAPHEINIVFLKSGDWNGTCSCKAGLAKCKHLFAILLYVYQ